MQKTEKETKKGSSRIIKFRAWDKKYKKWLDNTNAQGNPNNEYYLSFTGFVWAKDNLDIESFSSDMVDIHQFTGLLDKNGKEIYEGDLISEYSGEVRYNQGAFYIFHINGSGYKHTLLSRWIKMREKAGTGTEIIGNIYQNPGLLN